MTTDVNNVPANDQMTEQPRRRGRPPRSPVQVGQPTPTTGEELVQQVTPEAIPAPFPVMETIAEQTVVETVEEPALETTQEPTPQPIGNRIAETTARPVIWASLGAKINTGNYESQSIDIGVSGIPVGASQEFIDERISQAIPTIRSVVEGLAKEMGRIMREDYGR